MTARRFKSYPAYKNSGVEWLGEIPAHWEVKKVKRLCLVRRGASPRPIDDPIYFDDEGEYTWVRIADVTASERYLERTTQRLSALGKSKSVALEPGELFVSIAATVGKPVITKIKCCIHDGFVYFVGLHENREFLFYLFSCGEPYKGLGKLGTQLNLNTDSIGDIYLPRPGSAQQESIVQFLDRETSRIDALVAKKERLIELLQEQRTALITRAVTKGLDPNVPMKDSGVEWLGEIPAHWEVVRSKRLFKLRNVKALAEDTQLTASQHYGVIPQADFMAREGRRVVQVVTGADILKHVEANDFVISMRSFQGGIEWSPYSGAISSAYVVLAPSHDVWHPYFVHLLKSKRYIQALQSTSDLVRDGQALRFENFIQVDLPSVPLAEQRAIAAFLDQETARIDALAVKVREAIDRLKELRTALISAAVTGKIDVREEVA